MCDVWHYSAKPKNVHVAKSMDVPKFWKLMLDALRRANECSPLGGGAGEAPRKRSRV